MSNFDRTHCTVRGKLGSANGESWARQDTVLSSAEFQQYAQASIEAARNAATDDRRKHYLDMAKVWTKAAASLDGGSMMPTPSEEAAHD